MMVPLEQRTVVHMLREGARRHPERTAVRDQQSELTYGQLLERSAGAAAALRELGVAPGDPVLLMLGNHVDHVVAWFGASCARAVEVPLNTELQAPQLSYIANHCEARVLVIDAGCVDRLRAAAGELRHLEHVIVRGEADGLDELPFTVHDIELLRRAEPGPIAELNPWDPSGIMYTSGTTGPPKGVVVSHAQTYGRMLPLGAGSPQPGDTTLVTLPIYHVIGQCRGLYNTLIAGGTAVLEPRFSASRFWDSCRKHQVTYVPLVGVMATYLLRQPARQDDADNPVQRICLGTTIREVDRFRQRFAIPELYVSYGLTEVGGVLVGPAESTGCGWLRDDFEGLLVDEHDVAVAPGEVGELVLRPTEPWTVMLGYHKRPEETMARWRNLWLHTGDLMRQREDGMLIFVDRRSDRIRHHGENVSTGEVEQHIVAYPAVHECAVVGIASSDDEAPGDQDILAVVVPASGENLDPGRLIEFLSHRLPRFAVPRFVRIVAELPRTDSTRRVRKSVLAEQGAAGAWERPGASRVTAPHAADGGAS
jgi:crotonobetaine/carnitine-CoA ligase